jgi:hypothetical protein
MNKSATLALILILALSASASLQAQEAIKVSKKIQKKGNLSAQDIADINSMVVVNDTLSGWKYKWRGSLNGAQSAFNNWSSGGVNTISATALTYFRALYRKKKFSYALGINLKYGRAHIAQEGTRKTNDLIAVNNKLSYLFSDAKWSLFANLNFTTQFDKGYDYDVPDSVGQKLISDFFAPAYFSQILGVGFIPSDYFTAEAGLAVKETIVNNDALIQQYSLKPGQNVRIEPGFAVQLAVNKKIFKNVTLHSSIATFTNVSQSIRGTDVAFSNKLVGRINDYLHMNLQFVSVYDRDFSKQLQIKQVLSAGVSIDIL